MSLTPTVTDAGPYAYPCKDCGAPTTANTTYVSDGSPESGPYAVTTYRCPACQERLDAELDAYGAGYEFLEDAYIAGLTEQEAAEYRAWCDEAGAAAYEAEFEGRAR